MIFCSEINTEDFLFILPSNKAQYQSKTRDTEQKEEQRKGEKTWIISDAILSGPKTHLCTSRFFW